MKKVVVIVGPTGSGKTGLSIKLAKAFHAEIINGDSVQVYRGLDIGSAKIKKEDMQGVKHHLFDVCDPSKTYSVFAFQKDVRKHLENIDFPMIVGGTGLYIKAALYDYEFKEEKRDTSFEEIYQSYSNEALYEMLLALDPDITIDLNNRRRVLRALYLAQSGELRSQKTKKDDLLYEACIIYLDLDRTLLEQRLIERLDLQMKEGFIEEVKSLKDQGVEINVIGYRELSHYLDGLMTLEEAKAEIIKVSKKLAKKQKTFFKNQMSLHVLDAKSATLYEDAHQLITSFMQKENTK